jgi:hypothetical protein
MPYDFTVTAVRASLTSARSSGNIFTVDINESGTTILSTKLTIDNGEKTSTTAATAAVISDASLNRLRFIVRLLSDDGLYPNLEEFSGLRSPVAPGALEGGKPRSCRPH